MPLFEIDGEGLTPFRLLRGGAELYERQIESLLWDNLDEFTGEALFPLARQPAIAAGGRPDIVAMDSNGRVVVIEVKRDIDRGQLAQCLEYAGWARSASLDELGSLYRDGVEAFFTAWQEFTGSMTPMVVNRRPRLILVARDLHGRTESAVEYLIENGLPVRVIRVSLYEGRDDRRLVDVEGEWELDTVAITGGDAPAVLDHTRIGGRRVRLSDLMDRGLLQAGDALVWNRPRLGNEYAATLEEDGSVRLEDGRVFSSPSVAALKAANVPAIDGWYAWRVPRLGGTLLNDLRIELAHILLREQGGE